MQCKLQNWSNNYDGNVRSVYGPQTNEMGPIHTENRLKVLIKSAEIHEFLAEYFNTLNILWFSIIDESVL